MARLGKHAHLMSKHGKILVEIIMDIKVFVSCLVFMLT